MVIWCSQRALSVPEHEAGSGQTPRGGSEKDKLRSSHAFGKPGQTFFGLMILVISWIICHEPQDSGTPKHC